MTYHFGNVPDAYARIPGTLTLLPSTPMTVTDAVTGAPVTGLKDATGDSVTSVSTDESGEYAFGCDSPIMKFAAGGRVWGPVVSPDFLAEIVTTIAGAPDLATAAAESAASAAAAAAAALAAQAAAEAAAGGGGGGGGGGSDPATIRAVIAAALQAQTGITLDVTDPTQIKVGVAFGTSSTTAARGNDSRIVGAAQAAQNLADLPDKAAARGNLLLGSSATRNVGTTSGTVAAGDDVGFGADYAYLIAGTGAGVRTRRKADLDLTAVPSGSRAAALAAALAANPLCILSADSFAQDGAIALPTGASCKLIATDTVFTAPATLLTAGNARQAAFSIRGSTTQVLTSAQMSGTTTLAQGTRTIPHTNSSLPSVLAVNDIVELRSTQATNENRLTQYYLAHRSRVRAVSGTSLVLDTPLLDSFNTATLTVYRVNTVTAQLQGVRMLAHPSATGRQELLAVIYALNPLLRDCAASGPAAMHGLALWACMGGLIDRPETEAVQDLQNVVGFEGYGGHLAGCEGVHVRAPRGRLSRHEWDLGSGGSSVWGMTKHTVIEDGFAEKSLAAAFSNHGAAYSVFRNCTSKGAGGAFITRGPDTLWDGCSAFGTHADADPYGTTQATAKAQWYLGEPDASGSERAGQGGVRAIIRNCYAEAIGTDGAPTTNAVYADDPCTDFDIDIRCRVSGYAVELTGDTTQRGRIRVVQNAAGQYGSQGGVRIIPGTTSGSAAQAVTDVDIDYIGTGGLRGPAVQVGGGVRGGVSERVNIERVYVPTLGSGRAATDSQVVLGAGTWGDVRIGELRLPATNRAAAVVNTGGARLTYEVGKVSKFADVSGVDIGLARQNPQPARRLLIPHSGAGNNVTLDSTGSWAGRMWLRRQPVSDVLIKGVGSALASGSTAPVMGSGGVAVFRVGIYPDRGDGNGPMLGVLPFTFDDTTAGGILVDLSGALGEKITTLAVQHWDSEFALGKPFVWVAAVYQPAGTITTQPTLPTVATVPMTDPASLQTLTQRGFYVDGVTGALPALSTLSDDGTARPVIGFQVN